MRRYTTILAALAAILTATAACTFAAAPTTPPDSVSTIVAATMAAVSPVPSSTPISPTAAIPTLLMPTLSAPTASVPTMQAGAPTVAVPGAARINFLTGTTFAVVTAPIGAGAIQNYVLQGSQGQPMMLNVDSADQGVAFSLKTQGGTNIVSPSAPQATWQGSLPATEDYYIAVRGGATTENFTLTINIPARIKFKEGADSAKVSGKTVGGYNVSYVLFAIQDQKMSVSLDGLSGNAALTIWGWNDGQPYVRSASERSSFAFTLPSTQDYIIEVVPRAGRTVSYVMTVKIK